MQEATTSTLNLSPPGRASTDGFILLNSSLKPVFVNHVAAEILTYPQKLEARNAENLLASKVQALFVSEASVAPPAITMFQSGRRTYEAHAYYVNALAKGAPQIAMAILLQRRSKGPSVLGQISERFNLTQREQQVLQHLSQGLTTKEIAQGMEISPNTVKAFVRMIMVKMGVSTRSGIVGKAFSAGA
jgi:DNA-binding NarL/FixJ family response regulator